jgi:hypothetical protein
MGDMQFTRKLELNETVKYGAMLYGILAYLIMPAGICSSQHLALQFVPPTPYTIAQIAMERDLDAISTVMMSMEGMLDHDPVPQKKEVPSPALPYHHSIMRASQAYNVDAALIRAIIHAESNYNPQAVSRAGAQGLMQLMPSTARALGVEDTFDPDLNIDGGVRYFKRLLDRFDGDVELALAAYNAGSRHVRNYGGVPPFKATQLYIQKVLRFTRMYQQEMTDRVNYT